MTLEEAIANLTRYKDAHHSLNTDVIGKSMALSIEALKQVRQIRAYAKELFLPLLPGETEK